jgi:enoyl-[acyl-carrier protein] reductase I
MGLLAGKKGLIYGVRNKWSIGWGCAQSLAREGASFAMTYFGEREEGDVRKLAAELGVDAVPLVAPCNLLVPEEVEALHARVEKTLGRLDFVIHAVAFAKGLEGRMVDVSAADFDISLASSTYTLVAAAKAAEPLMTEGGSIVTLTYLGGPRVVPNYNTAGIAKAALESTVRYLAHDLGPQQIRVNAISAGPIKTLSALGIKGFKDIVKSISNAAPLKRSTTIEEVGDAAAFFVSDWSRGVTGDVLYVDSGYHVMGMPNYGPDTAE